MKKFRFEYEALLDVRKRAEEERQRVVAELERERLTIEDELRRCQQSIVQSKSGLREALAPTGDGARVDVNSVRLQTGAAFHLTHRAQQIALRLAGAHRRLESARAALLEATVARKAVETLKERRFEAWKTAVDRAEAAAMDEMATMRAPGRRRGEDVL